MMRGSKVWMSINARIKLFCFLSLGDVISRSLAASSFFELLKERYAKEKTVLPSLQPPTQLWRLLGTGRLAPCKLLV